MFRTHFKTRQVQIIEPHKRAQVSHGRRRFMRAGGAAVFIEKAGCYTICITITSVRIP
jgi:hypothetical protein